MNESFPGTCNLNLRCGCGCGNNYTQKSAISRQHGDQNEYDFLVNISINQMTLTNTPAIHIAIQRTIGIFLC